MGCDICKIFIVLEGRTEKNSFNCKFAKHFGGKKPKIRISSVNGKDVSPEGYSSKTLAMVREGMNSDCHKILCLLDKEKRIGVCEDLCKEFKKAIIKTYRSKFQDHSEEFLEGKIEVIMPNIMFENWIIADVEGIKESNIIKNSSKQKNYEGKNGAHILNRLMKEKYSKTNHAHDLFKKVDFSRAVNNSDSFRVFNEFLMLNLNEYGLLLNT